MSRLAGKVALITGRLRASGRRSPTDWPLPGHLSQSLTPPTGAAPKLWSRRSPPPARPALDCYSQEENQYKGDLNEHFKQPARVGCNRTSRKTCRKEFKKERRAVFGRDAKESESGSARGSIWGIALHRSR